MRLVACLSAVSAALLLVAAGRVGWAGEGGPDPEIIAQFRQAVQLLQQNKPDEAVTLLEQVAKKEPNEPGITYYLTKAYLAKKDEKAAFEAFTRSVNSGLLGSLEILLDLEVSPDLSLLRNSPEYMNLIAQKIDFGDAPELVAKDLDGKDVKLSDLRGKPVLLVFWRIGCSYCDQEFASLQETADKLKEKGLVVVGAAGDGVDEQKALIKKLGLSFSFWRYDLAQKMLPLVYTLAAGGTPASFFIDPQGRVVRFYQGFPRKGDFSYPINLITRKPEAGK